MCGIFGYLNYGIPRSRKYLCDTLVNGLHRLEYRGYDSAGFSVDNEEGKPEIFRVKGNVDALAKLAEEQALDNPDHVYDNHIGIAHTRWSTHGMQEGKGARGEGEAGGRGKGEGRDVEVRVQSTHMTSGEPAVRNSHPHSSDPTNQFVVVHNGIISNYASIKTFLV